MSAPRVLVAGAVLGQPMGGVRRHNAELLPRVAHILAERGGGLAVLEGETAIPFDLGPDVERIASRVPASPARLRARSERRALVLALRAAERHGAPFDVVHTAHLPVPARLGIPMTWTVHDLRWLAPAAGALRRAAARRVYARAAAQAARVCVVSDAVAEELTRRFPRLDGRIDRVGNGADHLPPLPRDPDSDPFVLVVGHLEPRKNPGLIVEALALDPDLPRVCFAGAAKGGAAEGLRAVAQSRRVADRVEWLGPVDDGALAQLYARAACAVFPSNLEGFGIGPAEALHAGCPVAASDLPAHREATRGAAHLFPPGDPAALAQAIRSAAGSPGPALCVSTWDECAESWAASLRKAAGARFSALDAT